MIQNKYNRQLKKRPKRGIFFCGRCDSAKVYEWSKCPVCGCRNGSKRFKKDG